MNSPLKRRRPAYSPALQAFWRDPRVSLTAKAVLQVIKGYGDANGDNCKPSAACVCGCLKIARRTFFRAIRELTAWKLITALKQGDSAGKQAANIYIVNDEHFSKHVARPFRLRIGGAKRAPQGGCQKSTTTKNHYQDIPATKTPKMQEAPENVIQMPKAASS